MEFQIADLVRYRSHPDQIIGLITRKGNNGWVKVAWLGFPYNDKDPKDFNAYTAYHGTELDLLSTTLNKTNPQPSKEHNG